MGVSLFLISVIPFPVIFFFRFFRVILRRCIRLFLSRPILQFYATDSRFIIHQRMQRDNGTEKTAQIHYQQLIVRAGGEALRRNGIREIGKEIERVLEMIYNLMVHGHGTSGDVGQVFLNVT